MLESLVEARPDPILALAAAFRNDPNPNKMDLGIGVYRDSAGNTPIMHAVRQAQLQLAEQQPTKAYLSLAGNDGFNRAITRLLLGETEASKRCSAIQTPGASGALRLLAELIRSVKPDATVWTSTPGYVNHQPIMQAAGLKTASYRYLDSSTKQINEAAMLKDISKLGEQDILLLHGCCHNPTGADISQQAWESIAFMAEHNGFIPFIDIAYQGFGDGIKEDCFGVTALANRLPELLVATSCSKNFGLYRERTGAALVVGKNIQQANNANASLQTLARQTYTMPPDHGAAIVEMVLNSAELTTLWQDELNGMRQRMIRLRQQLVAELRAASQSDRFDYLLSHKGMFSVTGLSNSQLDRLRSEFGIYIVGGGRINIAGLQEQKIPYLVDALLKCGA